MDIYYENAIKHGVLLCKSQDQMVDGKDVGWAIAQIELMKYQKPNFMKEMNTYRKYIPLLIAYCRQMDQLAKAYQELFDRYESDSISKKGQRWTDEEDELLIELATTNMSMLELSTTMGRTPSSIKTRLSVLVGKERLSQEIAGKFLGLLNGNIVDGEISGILYKEKK